MPRLALLSSTALLLSANLAFADGQPLHPRIETGFRLGTERGIVATEIWVPVRQGPDRVLYGDVRLSGDDGDNFEGNLGGGYRHIYGNAIFGAHVWIDRRHTARGSTFHQVTLGAEALGRNLDGRLNVYMPLSGGKTYRTPNTGSEAPYLAGSGIFYDTSGTVVEEPQTGFDLEFGVRVPLFEDKIDSIRAYAGGYHFGGDDTADITGWRTRVSADVTPWLQVGARFQKDAERGSQGFLEATLRLPGKASFKTEGLRARLDESPERDIDIVTADKVTDTGLMKPVLNADTGEAQRILHVDNTASGGDGSKDNPYGTLAAAQAGMKAYDVIYVHRGDGTTAGQDQGIVIDKPGVRLIGSGVDLLYDGRNVTGARAGTGTGTVLAAATAAPLITNTQAELGETTGNGILVQAGNTYVSGVTVQNATSEGIKIYAAGANGRVETSRIENVSAFSNGGYGLLAMANNGGTIDEVFFSDIESHANTQSGLRVEAFGAGSLIGTATLDGIHVSNSGNLNSGIVAITRVTGEIGKVTISNSEANSNGSTGFNITSQGGGRIGYASLSNFSANGNAQSGARLEATGAGSVLAEGHISNGSVANNMGRGFQVIGSTGGRLISASLSDVQATNNIDHGIYVATASAGRIEQATLNNISSTANSLEGLRAESNGVNSYVSVSMQNLTASNNGRRGVLVFGQTSGVISASLSNVTTASNADFGVYILSQNSAQNTSTLSHVTSTGNALSGVSVEASAAGIMSAMLQNVTAVANTQHGVYINDDTVSAFTADLGGGTLGSTGLNRIFGDTATDLRVDLDGGQLKAENNWWGNAAGLQVGERTLEVASTVDSTPFLTADPGP